MSSRVRGIPDLRSATYDRYLIRIMHVGFDGRTAILGNTAGSFPFDLTNFSIFDRTPTQNLSKNE